MHCGNIIINEDISASQMKNLQNIAGFDIKLELSLRYLIFMLKAMNQKNRFSLHS